MSDSPVRYVTSIINYFITATKEQVIVKHILKLVAQGFPLRLAAVANIANSLRAERNLSYVSLNWPSMFVKR